MNIKFTIHGNQDDLNGNPVPYVRSTRGALWRKDGKRYAEWKEYVQRYFYQVTKVYGLPVVIDTRKQISIKMTKQAVKPITLGMDKARMDIKIFWKNNAHGDPDNVWKGIADALFFNDKNLDGSFEAQIAEDGKGRVEVRIKIN